MGKASASFDYRCRSDIYWVDLVNENPVISIENLLFESNNYFIDQSNIELLDRMAEIITENKNYIIKIVGHTDNVGSLSYNEELSFKRAKTIYSEMIKRGIDKERMSYYGSGQENPIVKNSDDLNRKMNRRVELIFQKSD